MLNALQLSQKLNCAVPTVARWARELGLEPGRRGFAIDTDTERRIAAGIERNRRYAHNGEFTRDDLFTTMPILRGGDMATCPHCGARVVRRSLWPSAPKGERHTC